MQGDFAVEAVVFDVVYDFGKTFGEFLEILLVEENLVLVVGIAAVRIGAALAFCYGKVVVLVAPRGLDVKKVCTFPGPDGFGIDLVSVSAVEASVIVIFFVLRIFIVLVVQK